MQVLQILFVYLYGAFQLLDVFRPSLSKCSLRLSVSLFALFGRRVYLTKPVSNCVSLRNLTTVALLARSRSGLRLPACVLLCASAAAGRAPEPGEFPAQRPLPRGSRPWSLTSLLHGAPPPFQASVKPCRFVLLEQIYLPSAAGTHLRQRVKNSPSQRSMS